MARFERRLRRCSPVDPREPVELQADTEEKLRAMLWALRAEPGPIVREAGKVRTEVLVTEADIDRMKRLNRGEL